MYLRHNIGGYFVGYTQNTLSDVNSDFRFYLVHSLRRRYVKVFFSTSQTTHNQTIHLRIPTIRVRIA